MYLIEGFVFGLGMVIFIGPVFFLLLNSSIQQGISAGLAVALGIIVSDVICVILCYLGLSQIFISIEYKFWFSVIGSIILFVLGVSYIIKKPILGNKKDIKSSGFGSFFVQGFSVNFFNPFVFVVWIGVYQYGQVKYVDERDVLWFLIAVLIGVLTTDILKVFLSEKLRKFVTTRRLNMFFKIIGVLLLLFSIRILYIV